MPEQCWAMPDSEACPKFAEFYVEWHDSAVCLLAYAALACGDHTAQLRAGIPLTEYDARPVVTQVRDLVSHQRDNRERVRAGR